MKQRFHTAGHPTFSHLLQHINRTVKEALRKWRKSNGKNWDEKLRYFHGIVRIQSNSWLYSLPSYDTVANENAQVLVVWLPSPWEQNVVTDEWVET